MLFGRNIFGWPEAVGDAAGLWGKGVFRGCGRLVSNDLTIGWLAVDVIHPFGNMISTLILGINRVIHFI